MRHVFIALVTLALSGVPPAIAQSPKGPEELVLSVQVDVIPSGTRSRRPVTPGETLSVGDQIGLRVQVNRDAYVYVAQLVGGQPNILFSSISGGSGKPQDGLVHAGVEVGLPLGGSLIALEQAGAEDNLIVLASQQPLPKDPSALARFVLPPAEPTRSAGALPAQVRGRGDAPPPPPPVRSPPQPISTKDRTGAQRDALPQVVLGRAASGQVAQVRFPLHTTGKPEARTK